MTLPGAPAPSRDLNDLTVWFPAVVRSGAPYPRTEIVQTSCELLRLLDGELPKGWDVFLAALRQAADRLGYPCFLRTGHSSGKHSWQDTCFVARPEALARHVAALVEWSALADLIGLPTGTWVVRELLRLRSRFTAFKGLPVAREFRAFVAEGRGLCLHPYWPAEAFEPEQMSRPSSPTWREDLAELSSLTPEEEVLLLGRAEAVGRHLDGAWSVDLAQGEDGTWYVIDMAVAQHSFHWPGCPVRDQLKES